MGGTLTEWNTGLSYGQMNIANGNTGQGSYEAALRQAQVKILHGLGSVKHMSGSKPIVVCGGEQREALNMDEAQAIAEEMAHSKSADAYILKPVKKVAPKRDVVTTDL